MQYTADTTKETIVIFAGHVARQLLKRGFTIIDIKPDKTNSVKSVFVFRVENNIQKDIAELTYKPENARVAMSNYK